MAAEAALPKPLLRRWHLALALTLAAAAALAALVRLALGGEAVAFRVAAVLAAAGYLLASCRRHLRDNHDVRGGAVYESLGPANRLTLARGLLVASLGGFYAVPLTGGFVDWLPALVYAAAVAGDTLDGKIARRSGRRTRLGEHLDTEVDSLGVLLAATLVVSRGVMAPWFLLVGLARPVFVLTLYLRRLLGGRVVPLTGTPSGRFLAGAMMGFLVLALAPPLSLTRLRLAGLVFSVPFVAGFVRDWLRSAVILPDSSRLYAGAARALDAVFLQWAPVLLRAGWLAVAASTALASLQTPAPLLALAAALAVALVSGVAGRAAAVALSLLAFAQLVPLQGAGLLCVLALLILGTGRWSLWTPERKLFARNAG